MCANLANKRILIVDDDEAILDVTSLILRSLGAIILTTTSPAQAAEIIRNGHFDLVITDMIMPEINGLHLAHQIKAMRPNCKVLMLTGTPPLMRSEFVDAIVLKPFPAQRLRDAVVALL